MTMPGVTNGIHGQWSDRSSAFDYPTREVMSPNKHDSSLSNGYSSDQQSESEDGPTYLLEHLATFSVGRAHNIMDPTDGLNKLWQMEKRTGIWTQKMQIRLNKQGLVIIDYENGDVVERFPMHLISSPMAYAGTDPKELYNNILIFIVKEDPKRKNLNPSEMHIFQCVQVSAQVIVEDMKLFMSGKWKSVFNKSEHTNSLPPPPNAPAPEPPAVANGINVRQQVSRFNASTSGAEMMSSHVKQERLESRSSAYNHRDSIDETSSTSSEKYEKEVGILNHCFDDIEQFIAWLQSAAAAYRELERRRKTRKTKKKDHGDGMLSMRAKPPPERDFVDVLQKFKLSFNLLAKLKAHIHDPNAPELVHFLFTPLALIVDASRDSNYGPNLASKVVSPLLTKDAVELLINCLTSKESDLWHSLGESWIVPRDLWKGYVAPYHPSFRDGYSPEYPFNEDRERVELTASAAANAARSRRDDILKNSHEAARGYSGHNYFYDGDQLDRPISPEDRRRQSPYLDRAQSPHSDQEFRDVRSDISADSIERGPMDPQRQFERHQRQWLEDLRMRDSKVVQVIFPRTANNDKELSVFRGEFLEVLDDTRKWWKARNIRGQVAHVPHTIVTPYHLDDDAVFNNPLYSRGGRDMYGQDSPNRSTDGSMSGDRPSPRGPPIQPPAPADLIRKERQDDKPSTVIHQEQRNKPTPNKVEGKSKNPIANQESINEELKRTLGKKKKSRFIVMPRLPPICISESSTPSDVQVWLKAKGFDESIQNIFKGVDGKDMFSLSRSRLEKACGEEDGARLESQLRVQKSISGFQTTRGRELQEILEVRRLKSETSDNDSNTHKGQHSSNNGCGRTYDEYGEDEAFVSKNTGSVSDESDDSSNDGVTLKDKIQRRKRMQMSMESRPPPLNK